MAREEDIQEVPGSLAAATQISMDATVAVVLSELDGIFTRSASNDAKYMAPLAVPALNPIGRLQTPSIDKHFLRTLSGGRGS